MVQVTAHNFLYDPQQIIDYIKAKLNNETYTKEITPFYRGFKGSITKESESSYVSHGIYSTLGKDKLVITELPVGKGSLSFKQYKEFILTKMVDYEGASKTKALLLDEESFITDKNFKMTLTFKKDTLQEIIKETELFEKEFKLCNSINTSNIHLYDKNGFIKKYKNPEEILDEFYEVRLVKYGERKDYMLNEYQKELVMHSTKAQFIEDIMEETVLLYEKVNKKACQ